MGEKGRLEATADDDAVSDGPPAQVAPADASSGSLDETRSLSGTAGRQPPAPGSGSAPIGDPSKIGRYTILRNRPEITSRLGEPWKG